MDVVYSAPMYRDRYRNIKMNKPFEDFAGGYGKLSPESAWIDPELMDKDIHKDTVAQTIRRREEHTL